MQVRRAGDRFRTSSPGVESWHAFSSGAHYDPANTSFGGLLADDEHVLVPGAGFASHRHQDVEIVTWVLSGELTHEDSTGRRAVVRPGTVQVLSAGAGVEHVERADPRATEPVRFVQMVLLPDEPGGAPVYAHRDLAPDLRRGGVVAVRTPRSSATLHVARLDAGGEVVLPESAWTYAHVARGALDLDRVGGLAAGDTARLEPGDARVRRARADAGAEVLVWAVPGHAG